MGAKLEKKNCLFSQLDMINRFPVCFAEQSRETLAVVKWVG